ncbi:MAG: hypothetical protein JEZ12_11695 [Desulfobacterium sp.]|nr:hypothetical protein [Desulfobacterium sp.]
MKFCRIVVLLLTITSIATSSFGAVTIVFDESFPQKDRALFTEFHNKFYDVFKEITGREPDATVTVVYDPQGHPGMSPSAYHNLVLTCTVLPSESENFYHFYPTELAHRFLPIGVNNDVSVVYRTEEYPSQGLRLCATRLLMERGVDLSEFGRYLRFDIICLEAFLTGDFYNAVLDQITPSTIYRVDTNYGMNGYACELSAMIHYMFWSLDKNYWKKFIPQWESGNWSGINELASMMMDSCDADLIYAGTPWVIEKSAWLSNHPWMAWARETNRVGIDLVAVDFTGRYGLNLNDAQSLFVSGFSTELLNIDHLTPEDTYFDVNFFATPFQLTIKNSNGETVHRENCNLARDFDNAAQLHLYRLGLVPGQYTATASMNFNGRILSDEIDFVIQGSMAFPVTSYAESGGKIEPSGMAEVQGGGDQTFTISSDRGYAIDDVMVDGVSMGNISSYTFKGISRNDHTVYATFKAVNSSDGCVPLPDSASIVLLTTRQERSH